jgi:Spy/CpxP family protein refolding chaperone
MKKKSLITVAVIIAVAAVAGPFLYAGPGMRHSRGDFGAMGAFGRLARAKQALGLSDAQVDQIKAIAQAAREENAQYREQLRGGVSNVVDTLLKNPNDIAAAQAIIDQQTQAESALKSNVLKSVSKALNVLTPEQRTKLGQLISDRRAMFNRQF